MAPRTPEQQTPEGFVSSRHVGWVSTERLPWAECDDDHDAAIGLAEVTFDTGTVYIASAGTDAMNKVSTKVRENTETGRERGKTDELFMRAARLVAGGSDTSQNALITTVLGASSLLFNGFNVESMHESQRPNTRRVYYARTYLEALKPDITVHDFYPGEAAQAMVRLAITDKAHQLRLLSLITQHSRTRLRKGGAGSV